MTPSIKPSKFLSRTLWGAVLSFGILAGILLSLDWTKMETTLSQISPWGLITASFLMFGQTILMALRWHLLVHTDDNPNAIKSSVRITLASQAANQLFLASVTGPAVRIMLSVMRGIRIERVLAATILDRALSFGVLLLLVFLFLPFILGKFDHRLALFAIGLSSIGIFTGLVGVFVLLRYNPFFLRRLCRRNAALVRAIHHARRVLHPQRLGLILLLSFLGQFCYFGAIQMITAANNVAIGVWDLLFVLPLVSIVSAIPLSIGGWGIREGAFVYGLSLLNVPSESAFLVSIQVGVLSLLVALIGGIPALLSGHIWQVVRLGLRQGPAS